jgi:hypothetical protein
MRRRHLVSVFLPWRGAAAYKIGYISTLEASTE